MKHETNTPAESSKRSRRALGAAIVLGAAAAVANLTGGPSEAQRAEDEIIASIRAGENTQVFQRSDFHLHRGVNLHAQPTQDLGGERGVSQNIIGQTVREGDVNFPLVTFDEKGNKWYGFRKDDIEGDLSDQVVWVDPKQLSMQTTEDGKPFGRESPISQEAVDVAIGPVVRIADESEVFLGPDAFVGRDFAPGLPNGQTEFAVGEYHELEP